MSNGFLTSIIYQWVLPLALRAQELLLLRLSVLIWKCGIFTGLKHPTQAVHLAVRPPALSGSVNTTGLGAATCCAQAARARQGLARQAAALPPGTPSSVIFWVSRGQAPRVHPGSARPRTTLRPRAGASPFASIPPDSSLTRQCSWQWWRAGARRYKVNLKPKFWGVFMQLARPPFGLSKKPTSFTS